MNAPGCSNIAAETDIPLVECPNDFDVCAYIYAKAVKEMKDDTTSKICKFFSVFLTYLTPGIPSVLKNLSTTSQICKLLIFNTHTSSKIREFYSGSWDICDQTPDL